MTGELNQRRIFLKTKMIWYCCMNCAATLVEEVDPTAVIHTTKECNDCRGKMVMTQPIEYPDMFVEIFKLQKEFGSKFLDFDEIPKLHSTRQQATLDFIDNTIEELMEMRREMPLRKFWRKDHATQKPQWHKALKEYVDALHFFITIALVNGWSAKQIFETYKLKNSVNHDRQKKGY